MAEVAGRSVVRSACGVEAWRTDTATTQARAACGTEAHMGLPRRIGSTTRRAVAAGPEHPNQQLLPPQLLRTHLHDETSPSTCP